MPFTHPGKTMRLLAAGCLATLAACTQNAPLRDPPPDLQELARSFDCPIGKTATCERRTVEKYDCYCADKEVVRGILDPVPR